jgi:hypothetical protein
MNRRVSRFSDVSLRFAEPWTPEQIEERRQVILTDLRFSGKTRYQMQLLENETKYGEGRGRSAVASTIDLSNLNDHFGFEESVESMARIVELGSPFIALEVDEDWTGTVGGAKSLLSELAADNGYVASFRQVPKNERKSVIKVTFRNA